VFQPLTSGVGRSFAPQNCTSCSHTHQSIFEYGPYAPFQSPKLSGEHSSFESRHEEHLTSPHLHVPLRKSSLKSLPRYSQSTPQHLLLLSQEEVFGRNEGGSPHPSRPFNMRRTFVVPSSLEQFPISLFINLYSRQRIRLRGKRRRDFRGPSLCFQDTRSPFPGNVPRFPQVQSSQGRGGGTSPASSVDSKNSSNGRSLVKNSSGGNNNRGSLMRDPQGQLWTMQRRLGSQEELKCKIKIKFTREGRSPDFGFCFRHSGRWGRVNWNWVRFPTYLSLFSSD